MTHFTKNYRKQKIGQDDIDPWKSEDSPQLNCINYPILSPYPPHQTISFNPQVNQPKENKNINYESRRSNFVQNLRRYQRRKADEIKGKRQINFIERNRREVEEQTFMAFEDRRNNPLINSFLHNDTKFRQQASQFQASVEPVNWSMIMYQETDKRKQRQKHKDLQHFLNYHSVKNQNCKKKQKVEQRFDFGNESSGKGEGDGFQKMLKLREGIRKRNLKSASSKQILNQSAAQCDENEQVKLHSTFHSEGKKSSRPLPFNMIKKRVTPKSSCSNREKQTLQCKIEVIGRTNFIFVGKKERRSDQRAIHSSQRHRQLRKVLTIDGSNHSINN